VKGRDWRTTACLSKHWRDGSRKAFGRIWSAVGRRSSDVEARSGQARIGIRSVLNIWTSPSSVGFFCRRWHSAGAWFSLRYSEDHDCARTASGRGTSRMAAIRSNASAGHYGELACSDRSAKIDILFRADLSIDSFLSAGCDRTSTLVVRAVMLRRKLSKAAHQEKGYLRESGVPGMSLAVVSWATLLCADSSLRRCANSARVP